MTLLLAAALILGAAAVYLDRRAKVRRIVELEEQLNALEKRIVALARSVPAPTRTQEIVPRYYIAPSATLSLQHRRIDPRAHVPRTGSTAPRPTPQRRVPA